MAATATISEFNGAEAETTSLTNLNFGNTDAPNLVPATYPIRVQAGGYSFDKFWKLSFAGTYTSLSRFKVWKNSGVYFTDELIKTQVTTTNYTTLAFTTPASTQNASLTQNIPIAEPTGGDNNGANIEVGDSLSGTLTTPPDQTDYVGMQVSVSASTETGAGNQKVIRWQWDEQ